ncbi:ESX secretion-associated protein EspG [Actinophytocola sediminis]
MCWARLGLGELPPVLDLPSSGYTPGERQEIVAGVLVDLRGRQLADRYGPLPELAGVLTRLAQFSSAVDARIIRGGLVRARGAAASGRATIAVADGAGVTIRSVPEHALVTEMVALAGEAPTSRTDSVSVRAAALDRAADRSTDDGSAFADRLVALGEREADARAVARLCAGVVARGQFAVRTAGRAEAGRVVGYHDAAAGRFLQLRRDDWVTFTPANGVQLEVQVRQLLDEARR